MSSRRVMLIRSAPGTDVSLRAADLAGRWAGLSGSSLLFFQGPGLDHVQAGQTSVFAPLASDSMELRGCVGGWRRRSVDPLPPPFLAGSLIQFWAAVAEAEQVASFGVTARE